MCVNTQLLLLFLFFFFKQKTADEMRISDWSSDVCSSDLSISDVPIAVSAVTADQLQNTGAVDIRGLHQISPSLLISSTSSEAVGGVARLRGIGTVGDNHGLESSVAAFIDGVYRSRSGVAISEHGEVERIALLLRPQGPLFARTTSPPI